MLDSKEGRRYLFDKVDTLIKRHSENEQALNFAQEAFRRLDSEKKHGLELSPEEQLRILERQSEFQRQYGEVFGLEDYLHVYNEAGKPVFYIGTGENGILRDAHDNVWRGTTEAGIQRFEDEDKGDIKVGDILANMREHFGGLDNALTTSKLLRLPELRSQVNQNPYLQQILEKSKNHLDDYQNILSANRGWHRANNLLDGPNRIIIENPTAEDFRRARRTANFKKNGDYNPIDFPEGLVRRWGPLIEFEEDLAALKFLELYTGKNRGFLEKIAGHYGKTPWMSTPVMNAIRAAWLGCINDSFGVCSNINLGSDDVVFRRVRYTPKPKGLRE